MKKLLFVVLTAAAIACTEDDVKPKKTLDSEWYFENLFPLNSRFTIGDAGTITSPFVNYYSIPAAQRYPQINSINGGTSTGFTKLTLSGQGYTLEFFTGVVRETDPRFIDIDRLEFTAPGGTKTILEDAVVLKRLN